MNGPLKNMATKHGAQNNIIMHLRFSAFDEIKSEVFPQIPYLLPIYFGFDWPFQIKKTKQRTGSSRCGIALDPTMNGATDARAREFVATDTALETECSSSVASQSARRGRRFFCPQSALHDFCLVFLPFLSSFCFLPACLFLRNASQQISG